MDLLKLAVQLKKVSFCTEVAMVLVFFWRNNLEFDNGKYFVFVKDITLPSNKIIKVYELVKDLQNDSILNLWAKNLRNYYIEENMIDSLYTGTGLSKSEYLQKNIFPDPANKLGAATMSGEFGEILVHDFVHYTQNYYITKLRYLEKTNPNVPVSGSDVIGYAINNILKPSIEDKLLIAEVKTSSSVRSKLTIQDNPLTRAIADSPKDRNRIAESLNAEKRRLIIRNRFDEAKIVERFQNRTDNPYQIEFSAVAIFSKEIYTEEFIRKVINTIHIDGIISNILIIYSDNLLTFIRDLYRRACIC